jgi:hypothetical protein
MIDWFYTDAPAWLVALVVIALLLAAALLGRWVRTRRLGERGDEDKDGESLIMSAVLGLLALLLGFTFALAIDRFDNRRAMVVDEANAIRTTWLRAQLLDEPHRTRISTLLQAYTENRLALATITDQERGMALLRRNDLYQFQLWRATAVALRPIRNTELASSVTETTNNMIDMGAARRAARRAHVPPRVLSILLLYMIVSAYAIGYALLGARIKWALLVLLALVTLSYLLILDIDNPNRGGIREPQWAMEDLIENMRTHPPASYGPGGPPLTAQ